MTAVSAVTAFVWWLFAQCGSGAVLFGCPGPHGWVETWNAAGVLL